MCLSGVFGRQGIYGQNDSSQVPAMKEFLDKSKDFLNHKLLAENILMLLYLF